MVYINLRRTSKNYTEKETLELEEATFDERKTPTNVVDET